MGKIGDLFVRLGLKNDDFKRGIKEAKQDTESLGQSFNGLKGVAIGVWSAIGNLAAQVGAEIIRNAVKWGDAFIHHSQRIGDAWDNTMAGMKSAANAFFTAVSNWDWAGLGDKMRGAFGAGKSDSASRDAEFEVMNSIKLRQGAMQDELAQLRIEASDVRKSYDERAKAAQLYLDKVKPLYDEEIKLRQEISRTTMNGWLSEGGFSQTAGNRDALYKLLTEIAPNETLMGALDTYTKRNQGKKVSLSAEDNRILDEFFQQNGASLGGTLAAMASQYLGSGDKNAEKVVDAILTLNSAQSAFNEETRRLQTLRNSAEAGVMKADGSSSSAKQTIDVSGMESAYSRVDAAFSAMERREKEYATATKEELQIATNAFTDFSNELQPVLDNLQDQILEGLGFERIADGINVMQIAAEDMMHAVESGLVSSFEELANVLAGVEDANFGSVLKSLLTPLADAAISAGTIIMLTGKGIEALKASLTTLFGEGSIAAGAALVAIGVAAKAGLAAIGNSAGSTSATTSTNASGNYSYASGGVQSAELTVYVKGTIKGSDIVLAGQNTMNEWNK